MKSNRMTEKLTLLDELFADLASLPFDDDAARKYGEIRSDLAQKGIPIGPNDLTIAAIASVHEAVLITHNTQCLSLPFYPAMSEHDVGRVIERVCRIVGGKH